MLFEYEDVLKRNTEKLELATKMVDVILDNICALAIFQEVHFLWISFLKALSFTDPTGYVCNRVQVQDPECNSSMEAYDGENIVEKI